MFFSRVAPRFVRFGRRFSAVPMVSLTQHSAPLPKETFSLLGTDGTGWRRRDGVAARAPGLGLWLRAMAPFGPPFGTKGWVVTLQRAKARCNGPLEEHRLLALLYLLWFPGLRAKRGPAGPGLCAARLVGLILA